MGRKKKEYVLQVIRRVKSKYYIKQKKINGKIKTYFERRIPPISLPSYSPDTYYVTDEETFTKLLKIIDYLQSYNAYLEEKIVELSKRLQELENNYSELLGKYYLLRNYWAHTLCKELNDEQCNYSDFEQVSKIIENDLALMDLRAKDYLEFNTTSFDTELEIYNLKKRLRKVYKLDNF